MQVTDKVQKELQREQSLGGAGVAGRPASSMPSPNALVEEGKLKQGQVTPADVVTNQYNDLAYVAEK